MLPSEFTVGKFSGKEKKQSFREESKKYYDALSKAAIALFQNNSLYKVSSVIDSFRQKIESFGIKTEYFSNDWWYKFIKAATLNDDEGSELQSFLIKEIEKVNPANVRVSDFLNLYSLSIRVGLLNIGFYLRRKAVESSIIDIEKSKHFNFSNFAYGIGALYEKRDVDSITKHMFEASVCNPVYIEKEKNLRNIFLNNEYDYNPYIKNKSDEIFGELINDKSIAIVGPAKTSALDAKEIDSYDLVIRFNYKDKNYGTDNIHKGLRCDISYYNNIQSSELAHGNLNNFPTDIKWLVFRSSESAELVRSALESSAVNVNGSFRRQHHFSYVLFNCHLFALPNVVLDLLCFKPKSIKVFHCDLFINVDRANGYQAEYYDDNKLKYIKYIESFTHQDLMVQFYLLKTFYENKVISGDDRFSWVMNQKDYEYINHVQKLYGQYVRLSS